MRFPFMSKSDWKWDQSSRSCWELKDLPMCLLFPRDCFQISLQSVGTESLHFFESGKAELSCCSGLPQIFLSLPKKNSSVINYHTYLQDAQWSIVTWEWGPLNWVGLTCTGLCCLLAVSPTAFQGLKKFAAEQWNFVLKNLNYRCFDFPFVRQSSGVIWTLHSSMGIIVFPLHSSICFVWASACHNSLPGFTPGEGVSSFCAICRASVDKRLLYLAEYIPNLTANLSLLWGHLVLCV